MNSISDYFSEEINFFGYRLTLGQACSTVTALAIVTAYVVKTIWTRSGESLEKESTTKNPESLAEDGPKTSIWRTPNEIFWEEVEQFPTTTCEEGPVVVQGVVIFPSLEDAKKEMAQACKATSRIVRDIYIPSPRKGLVLDLGCGVGANSIPLYQKGWQVVAIDILPDAIEAYSQNLQKISCEVPDCPPPSTIVGDIVSHEYPENVDLVVCVDVLPYIAPKDLEKTMGKIFRAVHRGGMFTGTLFFLPNSGKNPLTELLGKLGAQFYPGKEFVREIITRSGFELIYENERNDRLGSSCLEFIAKK